MLVHCYRGVVDIKTGALRLQKGWSLCDYEATIGVQFGQGQCFSASASCPVSGIAYTHLTAVPQFFTDGLK